MTLIVITVTVLLSCCPFTHVNAQYKPQWPDPLMAREIFVLNLEDGYYGCQVNESADFLQLFELSQLCDGTAQCFRGSDEVSDQLKCTDRSKCMSTSLSLSKKCNRYKWPGSSEQTVCEWLSSDWQPVSVSEMRHNFHNLTSLPLLLHAAW